MTYCNFILASKSASPGVLTSGTALGPTKAWTCLEHLCQHSVASVRLVLLHSRDSRARSRRFPAKPSGCLSK